MNKQQWQTFGATLRLSALILAVAIGMYAIGYITGVSSHPIVYVQNIAENNIVQVSIPNSLMQTTQPQGYAPNLTIGQPITIGGENVIVFNTTTGIKLPSNIIYCPDGENLSQCGKPTPTEPV